MSTATVSRGAHQLLESPAVLGQQRAPGGGRKPLTTIDPGLQAALDALVEPAELGDPASVLRWTTASLRDLAEQLTAMGHAVGATTVGKLLHQMGYSLQAAAQTRSGGNHPDRDAQFRHFHSTVDAFLADGQPVISVDAKKKEAIGNYQRPGRTWRPKGTLIEVDDHAFPADTDLITPYGIYDLGEDTGWVNVGTDRATAAFAVESIRRWWQDRGHSDHPAATALLVTADAGGANGVHFHTWKWQLAAFACELGIPITVCHFPPGTSKWNKVEHRLFSRITCAWRGIPLTSYEVAVQAIAAAHTRTGLKVRAELDTHRSEPGPLAGRRSPFDTRRLPRRLELHAAPSTGTAATAAVPHHRSRCHHLALRSSPDRHDPPGARFPGRPGCRRLAVACRPRPGPSHRPSPPASLGPRDRPTRVPPPCAGRSAAGPPGRHDRSDHRDPRLQRMERVLDAPRLHRSRTPHPATVQVRQGQRVNCDIDPLPL